MLLATARAPLLNPAVCAHAGPCCTHEPQVWSSLTDAAPLWKWSQAAARVFSKGRCFEDSLYAAFAWAHGEPQRHLTPRMLAHRLTRIESETSAVAARLEFLPEALLRMRKMSSKGSSMGQAVSEPQRQPSGMSAAALQAQRVRDALRELCVTFVRLGTAKAYRGAPCDERLFLGRYVSGLVASGACVLASTALVAVHYEECLWRSFLRACNQTSASSI